jgi:hypothetical protein
MPSSVASLRTNLRVNVLKSIYASLIFVITRLLQWGVVTHDHAGPAPNYNRRGVINTTLEFELLMGVVHQDPAHGQRQHARVIPPGCGRADQGLGQSGQALAFEAWAAVLAWLPSWGRFVEGGIQPQASPDSPRRCSCRLVRRGG